MLEQLRVEPGSPAKIADRDPGDRLGLGKDLGKELIEEVGSRLDMLKQRLFAEGKRALLLVLQGLDASGKDGVIRSVFEHVSAQGLRVVSFRVPTATEIAHDYLWRVHAQLPARGEIVVFNRSHYEDVVAVRMHHLAPKEVWNRRPGHIREWERMLTDEGTAIIKVFLNVSKDEQRQRLQERIDDPEKRWKFRRDDLDVVKHFDEYIAAYEETLTATSTEWAPWYVVPADHNWAKALAVAQLLVAELERIDPQLPPPEQGIEGLVI